MSEQQESAPLKKVVAKVMAFLKLDDCGRVDKFFDKQVKAFKDKIKVLERNATTAEIKFSQVTDKYNDNLEDAKESLEEAYLAIKPEDISSNEAIDRFSVSYWANIEAKERAIEKLNDDMKAQQEAYDEEAEENAEQIALLKARIAKISELV